MRKTIIFVLLFLFIVGCAAKSKEHGHTSIVRTGILRMGINKKAFIEAWGDPYRTGTVASEEFVRAGWSGGGGGFFKGRRTLVVWSYEKIGIELAFDGNSLVGWKTDKTVQELKAVAKPLPE
jgi:hypothetical protein